MATTYKILGQLDCPATTLSDLYTVPALTSATASTLIVCNRNSSMINYRVATTVSGATTDKDYIFYDLYLTGNDTREATFGITLQAGAIVRVYSDTANVSFTLYGLEIS